MERSIEVTSRELALIHEALQNQILNTSKSLQGHIEQNESKFKTYDELLFHPTTGLTYRVYGAERSVKGACTLLRWFSGIASALIVALLLYVASQVSDLLRTKEQVQLAIGALKLENTKK